MEFGFLRFEVEQASRGLSGIDELFVEPPFGRLKDNVRTSSIARWKASVRLPIRHN